MKLLEDRILRDGELLEGDILMVDTFLNHQVDIELLEEMSKDIREHFDDKEITKICVNTKDKVNQTVGDIAFRSLKNWWGELWFFETKKTPKR